MRRSLLMAAAVAGSTVLVSAPSHAAPRQLHYHLSIDLGLTLGGITAWVTTQILEPEIAPKTCRWCSTDSFDVWFRDHRGFYDPHAANITSSVLAFGVVPAGIVALEYAAEEHDGGHTKDEALDILYIAEATALSMDLDQTAKYVFGRERPFVHYLAPAQKPLTATPSDNNVSFYSGHTALTFSIVTAAGTVAEERGLRWAPVIWAVGLPAAAITGWLRVEADKHWMTDVIAGAVFGSAVGWGVPTLLHSPLEIDLHTPGSAPGSAGLTMRMVPTLGGLALLGAW